VRGIKIALVSSSPRRREILEMVGIPYRVIKKRAEEIISDNPYETAVENSRIKLEAALEEISDNEVGLSADTVVVFGGEILGKPKDESEAVEILKRLSGSWHTVITGFSLFIDGRVVSSFEESKVKFKRLTKEEIIWYVSTGEPLDKAGAYGVQGKGALLIERIEGDFFNVMGLPISKIYDIISLAI
jgi:septum formation protein